MGNSAFGAERADELLFALGEQLAAASQRFDLVVIVRCSRSGSSNGLLETSTSLPSQAQKG